MVDGGGRFCLILERMLLASKVCCSIIDLVTEVLIQAQSSDSVTMMTWNAMHDGMMDRTTVQVNCCKQNCLGAFMTTVTPLSPMRQLTRKSPCKHSDVHHPCVDNFYSEASANNSLTVWILPKHHSVQLKCSSGGIV